MNFDPVRTLAELQTLDQVDMIEGYASAERGDPEPGLNRGKAFWHGWRCRMLDYGEIPQDEAHRQLVREVMAEARRGAKDFETAQRDMAEASAASRAAFARIARG